MDAEPLRYDYRPDKHGLIFVYRNEAREGRAVDARKPAVQLAGSSAPVADEPPGLSLGIFAAVSPVDEPVQLCGTWSSASRELCPVTSTISPPTRCSRWGEPWIL